MVNKVPCLRESSPADSLYKQGYGFYSLSKVDKPEEAVWRDAKVPWRCGEYDEDDICLCNRCALALGINW